MSATRRELIRAFVAESPLVNHLGIEIEALEDDRAVLRLPYRPELATGGDVVHGGAIATLADTAGVAAAWADDTVPERMGGGTVSLAVDYVSAAVGADLVADARVVRRGRSLCFCEITVTGADGAVVAKALLTHRFA